MKPQVVAVILAAQAVFSLCAAPARAEVVEGFTGKWKAANNATIFEVLPDGSYKSTTDGVVIETGKLNATNGIWIIRSDSNRVDKGSYTLNGSELQLKGDVVTTVWYRITDPTVSPSAAVPTVMTGSFATPASAAPTAPSGTATTTVNTGSVITAPPTVTATPPASIRVETAPAYTRLQTTPTAPMGSATAAPPTVSDYNERRLNDRQQAIQRFREEYASRRDAMMRKTPGAVVNPRRFMRGY